MDEFTPYKMRQKIRNTKEDRRPQKVAQIELKTGKSR